MGCSHVDEREIPAPPNPSAHNDIVHGVVVEPQNRLAQEALLLLINRPDKQSSCTAVALTPTVLLTAAHCVYDTQPFQVKAIFPSLKKQNAMETAHTVLVSRISIHKDYDGTPQKKADLALLKLTSPIPSGYQTMDLYNGTSPLSSDDVILLGFGITDETKQDSLVLRTTQKSFKSDVVIKNEIIGFNQKNKSGGFCRGDSGAPVYVTVGGVHKLIGINSFSVGMSPNTECHTASFAMYIPYFKHWIVEELLQL